MDFEIQRYMLQDEYDDGLITNEEYDARMQEIYDAEKEYCDADW